MNDESKKLFEWLTQAIQMDSTRSSIVWSVFLEAVRKCPEWRTPEENLDRYKKYIEALAAETNWAKAYVLAHSLPKKADSNVLE